MGLESIETLDLEVFLAVVRNGSIGGAAHELRLSSPSVSGRMASLERKVGTRLLERTARGSFTTPAGDRLCEYAKNCLDLLDEAHRTLRTSTPNAVTVAVPASLGIPLLGPALKTLSDVGVRANGQIEDTRDVIQHLLDGRADIGFVVNGLIPRSLESERIVRSSILPVVNPRHPLLESLRTLAIDDLDEFPVAIYRWHSDAEAIGNYLGHSRAKLSKPTVYVGLPPALLELVGSLDYVGILAEFSLVQEVRKDAVRILPLKRPSWTVDVDLIFRPSERKREAVQVLLDNVDYLSSLVSLEGSKLADFPANADLRV